MLEGKLGLWTTRIAGIKKKGNKELPILIIYENIYSSIKKSSSLPIQGLDTYLDVFLTLCMKIFSSGNL